MQSSPAGDAGLHCEDVTWDVGRHGMTAVSQIWRALQRPPASWLCRFALAAALIGLLAVFVDFSAAIRTLRDMDPALFLLAVAISLAAWLVNSVKWWLLLHPLDPEPRLPRLYEWNLRAIFYGQLLPGMLAGEAVKGYRLYRQTGSAGPVIVSISADRLTGLTALVLLGSLALVRSSDLRNDPFYLGAVIALGVAVPALLLALFTPALGRWIRRLEAWPLLSAPAQRAADVVEQYHGRYPLLAGALLLSLAFQVLSSVGVYALGEGMDLGVGLLDMFWVFAAASLVALLPIAFGGLGAREGSLILLLGPLGVSSEQALTLGLLIFGMQLTMALLGGALELKALLWPLRTTSEPEEVPAPAVGRAQEVK